MDSVDVIYIGNSTVLELQALTNAATDLVDTGATVTITLYDSAGVAVTGQAWPAPMSHVSAGTYRATLDHDLALVENRQYVAHIDATSGGIVGHWELPVRAKVRT